MYVRSQTVVGLESIGSSSMGLELLVLVFSCFLKSRASARVGPAPEGLSRHTLFEPPESEERNPEVDFPQRVSQ
jgi:hypothetical protein